MCKCKYIDTCPAATGWCNNMEPLPECLSMVINHYKRLKNQKGVLIFRANCFFRKDEYEDFRKNVIEQIKSGVVVVPSSYTVEYVPTDGIVKSGDDNGAV